MNSKKRFGLSLTETTMVLGLIGILAVTMLSLNNFNANDEKLALTKLAQADNALMSWSKAQVGSNETGLGIAQTINSPETLDAAIQRFFNNTGSESDQSVEITSMDTNLDNATVYTLNNGVKLYAQYTFNNSNNGIAGGVAATDTPVAIFIASAGDNITEEYFLDQQSKLTNVADKYAGITPQHIKRVSAGSSNGSGNGGNGGSGSSEYKYVFCMYPPCGEYTPGGDNPGFVEIPESNVPKTCRESGESCGNIYIGDSTETSCGADYTGTKVTRKIGSIYGDTVITLSSCCPFPKFDQNTSLQATPVCECDRAKMAAANLFSKGEVEDNSATCKRPAQPGEYAAAGGIAKLCGTDKKDDIKGYYCDEFRLDASKICPKGNYCPQTITQIQYNMTGKNADGENVYDESKVTTSSGKEIANNKYKEELFLNTKSDDAEGGLIYALKCPKGYYCPENGLTEPIPCKPGYYCPDEGLTAPIKCAAGTYQYEEGQITCIACPDGTFQLKEGQTSCSACPKGTISTNANIGECMKCAKGHFAADAEGNSVEAGGVQCAPCPAGTYLDEEGQIECKKCECNEYQDEEGQTSCKSISIGYYATRNNGIWVGEGATGQKKCEVGNKCYFDASGCPAKMPCSEGTYQNQEGQTECNDCAAGTYQDKEGATECNDCAAGTYQDKVGQAECKLCECDKYQDKTGQAKCENITVGYYATRNNGIWVGEGATGQHICEAGNKCYFDASGCPQKMPCIEGTYQNQEGQIECIDCPCGTYNDSFENPTAECTKCPDGTYSTEIGAASSTTCLENTDTCKVISHNEENFACNLRDLCPADQYRNENGECVSCPNGKIKPECGDENTCVCSPAKQEECAKQELSIDSDCNCFFECPAWDKLYVVRYAGLNEAATLEQQLLGIETVRGNKRNLNPGIKQADADTIRNTSIAFKAIAKTLSDQDKKRDFSKFIGYIIGVKFTENGATISENDLKSKLAYSKITSDDTIVGQKTVSKRVYDSKTRKYINKNTTTNTTYDLHDIFSEAKVVGEFSPNTWYYKFMTGEAPYENAEVITNFNDLDISDINSSIHNVKCTYTDSKGATKTGTTVDVCINNNGTFTSVTCKAQDKIKNIPKGYYYDKTNLKTCTNTFITPIATDYSSQGIYTFANMNQNIDAANPDLHQIKKCEYYLVTTTDFDTCKKHYGKPESKAAGVLACLAQANISKNEGIDYFQPYNSNKIKCRSNDTTDDRSNTANTLTLDDYDSNIHKDISCSYKNGTSSKTLSNKPKSDCEAVKNEKDFKITKITCKAEKDMPAGYIHKYDAKKATCRTGDGDNLLANLPINQADKNLHKISTACEFYSSNKVTINGNNTGTAKSTTDIKTCLDMRDNKKVMPTITYPVTCKSKADITKVYPDYFKGNYIYNANTLTCRYFDGSKNKEQNTQYVNIAQLGGSSDMSCEALCKMDRLENDKECISSCKNIKLISSLGFAGTSTTTSTTSTRDGDMITTTTTTTTTVTEFTSGGKISLHDSCDDINVAESFRRYGIFQGSSETTTITYENKDPVILDLLGNGINVTKVNATPKVMFDIDANGKPKQMAWTAIQTEFDDAFLCLDKNGNGQIDDGSELFGEQQGAATGIHELAEYDDNEDGVIDAQDEVYPELLLWVDFNRSGTSEEGELKTLEEVGITEISLDYDFAVDKNGKLLRDKGTITGIQGSFKRMVSEIIDGIETLVEKVISIIDAFFNTK